ncbi:MAG: ABC transporter substrate-binding protein, partial [Methanophagales archaeon]|nr:ABC transporter substrate-binding protein [Methanophagales archaeon]
FIQIKLIIVGKEKELTYVDLFGEMATVHKPIKRLVVFSHSAGEVIRALNVQEIVVGVDEIICDEKLYFLELSKLPMVGSWHVPDYEAILNQNPDAVMTFIPQAAYWATKKAEWNEKLPGVNIITLGYVNPPTGEKYTDIDKYNDLIQSTRKLGYILDKEDEAEEFCDWWEGYFNTIKSRTDQLSEDEKPRVFMEWLRDYKFAKITRAIRIYNVAGGIDICADAGLPSGQVDPEWVIVQNPDIIVKHVYLYYTPCGYEVDDPSELIAAREEILNRPELAAVSAVKNNRVYILAEPEYINGPGSLFGIAYCAKWFHPDLFEDLDPEAIHQEYLDRFQHIDYDLDEHGVFVYPPIEINGGLAGIPDKYKGQI